MVNFIERFVFYLGTNTSPTVVGVWLDLARLPPAVAAQMTTMMVAPGIVGELETPWETKKYIYAHRMLELDCLSIFFLKVKIIFICQVYANGAWM